MKLILPLSVVLPKKTEIGRTFLLNMNMFRHTHYLILNEAKTIYRDLVVLAIGEQELSESPPYDFHYTIYPGSNALFDLVKVLPILRIFTDDALISLGIIRGYNHRVITSVIYSKSDKNPPRAELEIVAAWR